MSRQHPWPHVTGNRILILILVSEILDHCQNLLDDPRSHVDDFKARNKCLTAKCFIGVIGII